jgi:hypothetical protein
MLQRREAFRTLSELGESPAMTEGNHGRNAKGDSVVAVGDPRGRGPSAVALAVTLAVEARQEALGPPWRAFSQLLRELRESRTIPMKAPGAQNWAVLACHSILTNADQSGLE